MTCLLGQPRIRVWETQQSKEETMAIRVVVPTLVLASAALATGLLAGCNDGFQLLQLGLQLVTVRLIQGTFLNTLTMPFQR